MFPLLPGALRGGRIFRSSPRYWIRTAQNNDEQSTDYIDEAIHIRNAGAKGQVLILGYTPLERTRDLIEYNITQSILSEEYAEKLAATNLPIKGQFALYTGMKRIGLNADHPDECERVIREYVGKLNGMEGAGLAVGLRQVLSEKSADCRKNFS